MVDAAIWLHNTAARELSRQVATECKERSFLMTALWDSFCKLLELKSASIRDKETIVMNSKVDRLTIENKEVQEENLVGCRGAIRWCSILVDWNPDWVPLNSIVKLISCIACKYFENAISIIKTYLPLIYTKYLLFESFPIALIHIWFWQKLKRRIDEITENHENDLRIYDHQSRNLAEKLVKVHRQNKEQGDELKIVQATLKVVWTSTHIMFILINSSSLLWYNHKSFNSAPFKGGLERLSCNIYWKINEFLFLGDISKVKLSHSMHQLRSLRFLCPPPKKKLFHDILQLLLSL